MPAPSHDPNAKILPIELCLPDRMKSGLLYMASDAGYAIEGRRVPGGWIVTTIIAPEKAEDCSATSVTGTSKAASTPTGSAKPPTT